jgi:hypothetical protein
MRSSRACTWRPAGHRQQLKEPFDALAEAFVVSRERRNRRHVGSGYPRTHHRRSGLYTTQLGRRAASRSLTPTWRAHQP